MSGKTFPEYSWGRHTNATLIGSKIAGGRQVPTLHAAATVVLEIGSIQRRNGGIFAKIVGAIRIQSNKVVRLELVADPSRQPQPVVVTHGQARGLQLS